MYDLEGPRETPDPDSQKPSKVNGLHDCHTIQWLINYPDCRVLLSSGTGGQVEGFFGAIKTHFQTNGMFRYLFPEFCPPAIRSRLRQRFQRLPFLIGL